MFALKDTAKTSLSQQLAQFVVLLEFDPTVVLGCKPARRKAEIGKGFIMLPVTVRTTARCGRLTVVHPNVS